MVEIVFQVHKHQILILVKTTLFRKQKKRFGSCNFKEKDAKPTTPDQNFAPTKKNNKPV